MLQLLLAVVGMTMAGALGYALIEQSNAQSALAVSREDNRRLDMAAEALTRRLVDAPPLGTLMAPVGRVGDNYYELPADLGVPTANTKGVPFLYCPLASVDQSAEVPAGLISQVSIVQPGIAPYTANIYAGGVISEDGVVNSGVQAQNPVAVIVSAAAKSTLPLRCNRVTYTNGKIMVDGGLARVITVPRTGLSTKSSAETQTQYYISQNGSGDASGRDANNTAIADGIWRLLAKTRPAAATLNVVGYVQTGDNFQNYAQSDAMRGTDLNIIGVVGSNSEGGLLFDSDWTITGAVSLKNIRIRGQFIVGANGRLQIEGNNIIQPSYENAVALNVHPNGKLTIKNSNVKVDNQLTLGGFIFNQGEATIMSSAITTSRPGPHYIITYTNGYTNLFNSVIGRSTVYGEAKATAPIYLYGKGRLMSTGSVVTTGTTGVCIGLTGEVDDALKWSPRTANTHSRIPSEQSYPPPAVTASEAVWSQYRADVDSRQNARQQHSDGFSCVN